MFNVKKLINLLLGLTLIGCISCSSKEKIPRILGAPEIPDYVDSIAVGNTGKEMIIVYDTNKDGISDLGYFYEIVGRTGEIFYVGELEEIRDDLNKDGLFDLNETIWKKEKK